MRAHRIIISGSCLVVVLAAVITLRVESAVAATCRNTVVVKDAGDSASPTQGQLRTAIGEVCNGGTVRLRPGVLIMLGLGELVVPSGKTVKIVNPSQSQFATIDAHGASRVLLVQASANLTLENVIVRAGFPAGIHNDGSLTISGGQVTGNTGFGLVNMGGAARLIDDAVIAANQGAGVFNGTDINTLTAGQLTLEDESRITGNVGTTGGGISNGGRVVLNDSSSIAGNEAQEGGGVYNAFGCCTGSLVLNDSSRITDNYAPFGAGVGGRGAVILNDRSAVVANRGEGINNVRGDVVLSDDSSVSENEGFGVSVLGTGVTLNDHSSIIGNKGPGVRCIDAPVILNGSAQIGENEAGGIRSGSCLVVLNGSSSVSGNTDAGDGGGIENQFGRVVLNDQSTISGNVARLGGGIYSVGDEETPAPVTLNGTSAITGNVATGGQGGGIYNEVGTATLNDGSSITGNIPDDCYPPTSC